VTDSDSAALTDPVSGPASQSLPERLRRVYARLLGAYGPQGWWPGSGDPLEVVVGAVLTQSVSWSNVELALANLRAAGALTLPGLHALDDGTLATLLRPSGYYTVKARRLRAVVRLVMEDFGGDLARLLRTIAEAQEEAARVEADARSLTAQARFTAWLVTLLPAGAAVLAELAQPGYLGGLADEPLTAVLLVLALACQALAGVLVRRIARLEGT